MSELEKTVVASYAKALESLSDEARAELIRLLSRPSTKGNKSVDERFWSSFGHGHLINRPKKAFTKSAHCVSLEIKT